MGAEHAIPQSDGCWGIKGPDFDTILIGPIIPSIVDADRLVRTEWRNGFPNWALYRTCLAGDSLHTPMLRRWVVAFTVAYCLAGGIKRQAYSDELAAVAAWDALHMLIHSRQLQPYTATADALGVHHKTYRCLRDTIYARLRASLDEYWIQLSAAFRHVVLYERRIVQ